MREGSTRAVLGGEKTQIANPSHVPGTIQLCLQKEEVSFRQNWVRRDAGCIPTALFAHSQGSSASPAAALGWHSLPQDAAGEIGVLQ